MRILAETFSIFVVLFALSMFSSCGRESHREDVNVSIVLTTDMHGAFVPYDFLRQQPDSNSLGNVMTAVRRLREENPDGVILLDNGDLIEGTPSMYYYNYVAVREQHLASRVMNFMQYDALTLGNHDLEGGESVYYDHLLRDYRMPWLCANAIDSRNDRPMFKPYTIIHRKGCKIAVFGLVTSEVPTWVPKLALPHLEFESMLASANYWVPLIEQVEKPDLLIGMFHAGSETVGSIDNNGQNYEDGAIPVIKNVRGFDLLLIGHDHLERNDTIVNNYGDTIPVFEPASHGETFGQIDLLIHSLEKKANGHLRAEVKARSIKTSDYPLDEEYMKHIAGVKESVDAFLDSPIGDVALELNGAASLVGPSTIMDLVHSVQLSVSGADISMASCISDFTNVKDDTLTMRQLFAIYKYENQISKIWMSGYDVKRFLEFGYSRQFSQMRSADDHLLSFVCDKEGRVMMDRFGPVMLTPQYNFTSAAGINYTVDVSKKMGDRVTIHSMADGSPFQMEKRYNVVLSSYQAAGGGAFLPIGLGWNKEDIEFHTIYSTVRDMRYYINQYIREYDSKKEVSLGQWQVVPQEWWQAAKDRDLEILLPYLLKK